MSPEESSTPTKLSTSKEVTAIPQEDLTPIRDVAYPSEEALLTATDGGDRKIIFKAALRTQWDEYYSNGAFAIQYYHAGKQAWLALDGPIKASQGKLYHEYPLISEGHVAPGAASLFLKAMEMGAFPMLRLINAASAESQWTAVMAFGGLLHPDPAQPGDFIVDFGGLWVLDQPHINQHLEGEQPDYEYAIAALPRPRGNHTLFGPLHAALTETDVLSEYREDLHMILLRSKDGTIETSKALASAELTGEATAEVTEEPVTADNTELLSSQLQLQQSTIESLNRDLDSKASIIESQDQLNTQLQTELTATKAEVDRLNSLVEASTKTSSSVTDVYQQIVNDVNTASKATQESLDSAYTLGNVSLNIKTFVKQEEDGLKLQLVDAFSAEQVKESVVSDLTIDVITKDPTSGTKQATISPRVTGLTETASRRRLAGFGLKLKAIYQQSDNQVNGQAFKQYPEAGADVKPGDTITVIFAKNEPKF